MIAILLVVVGILVIALLVLNVYPAFGAKPAGKGKYANQIPTPMGMDLKTTASLLRDFIKGNPKTKPTDVLPMGTLDASRLQGHQEAKVTWFGHSALLLELDGKTLLLDPMFGRAPSPFPRFGGKRYSESLPIEIEDLPAIDAVLFSHDHYDHLDYGSIKRLKDKVGRFYVPLGVGAHLQRWGVEADQITEHDWWQESEWDGIIVSCTPARHFSGRSLTDRNATLWCSWVIAGQETKVYFSGDSGYGPHFQEIGDKHGPFDMTFLECGQYDARWANIHMLPEETVQAHVDLQGKVMMPIHWAAFTLSLHDWNDPVERAWNEAKRLGVEMTTPHIGETIRIGSADYPHSTWWR